MADFERLVLGCIGTDFWKWILIRKLSTRSARFTAFRTAPPSKYQQKVDKHFPNEIYFFFQNFAFSRNSSHYILPLLLSMLIKMYRNFATLMIHCKTIINTIWKNVSLHLQQCCVTLCTASRNCRNYSFWKMNTTRPPASSRETTRQVVCSRQLSIQISKFWLL